MSDPTDPDGDYRLVIRGYGRLLLWLGLAGIVIGLFVSANTRDAESIGLNWVIAGSAALLAAAHLLQGAQRR